VLFGSQPFTSKLVMSNLEWFKYCWYWEKSKGANFSAIQWQPLKVIEEIAIFSEGGVTYTNGAGGNINFNPQKIPLKNPYKRDFRGNKSKSETTFLRNQNAKIVEYTEKSPRNLLYYSTDGDGRVHPTQKPVALLSYLIRTYTSPGEIILDNTAGSGTTLVAAQNEGRQAIGIELDEDYCKIAVDRLKQPSFFSIPLQDKPKPIQTSLIKDD
jgi:site-specific DNA-methyltransferase (adenine-specific)